MTDQPLRILIVDDEAPARHRLHELLDDCSTALPLTVVAEAVNGREALDILGSTSADLLLVDIHMPEVNGLMLLKWIREQEEYKTMPVIIITSSQEKSEILEAGKLGASHYVVKPFNMNTLREKLASTWQKHGQKFSESLKKPG